MLDIEEVCAEGREGCLDRGQVGGAGEGVRGDGCADGEVDVG